MTAYGANCENGLFLRSAAVFNIALGAKPAMLDEPCKGTRELNHSQGNGQENGPKSLVSLFAKAFGPNHPQAAKMLHKQARFYHKLKKYTEAEALYQQSLAIAEKVFSERDTELASILNNLARLYQDQNRHEEATPLYQRSLAIVEGTFGSVHPKVARRLHNLVALYQAQGKSAEAEQLHARYLAISQQLRSDRHHLPPDVRASQPISRHRKTGLSRFFQTCIMRQFHPGYLFIKITAILKSSVG